MRLEILVVLFVAAAPRAASAEWQVKPFLANAFGGSTTIFDLEEAADRRHVGVGGSVVLLGNVLGVEADVAFFPGFFDRGNLTLVLGSRVTTLTGNLVVALPRRLSQYTLRPYAVVGAGLMRVRFDDPTFGPRENMLAFSVGGGATGFLTERLGLSWDLRYFRGSGDRNEEAPISFVDPKLSFWRVNMALAVRY
ncbi:MAG TPA: outer membrane beta-barrel protein [Vicinamibacterales bacterium]|nr:outer membrane beta-barrel protein [Vicinamibacterales bacterium]